jgi:sarcosine oxidase delta subunit
VENLPAPAWFDPAKILEQIIAGKRTEDVAKALNVTKDQLVYRLVKNAPEEWQGAQLIRDLRRKEEAEDSIDSADDMLKLRKAEAKLKSAQWSLERVCRRIYGDVKEDQSTDKVSITLNIGIRRPGDDAKVIDQTPPA